MFSKAFSLRAIKSWDSDTRLDNERILSNREPWYCQNQVPVYWLQGAILLILQQKINTKWCKRKQDLAFEISYTSFVTPLSDPKAEIAVPFFFIFLTKPLLFIYLTRLQGRSKLNTNTDCIIKRLQNNIILHFVQIVSIIM